MFIELDKKKRVSFKKFLGRITIDLREFHEYPTSKEMKPKKKGIGLSTKVYMKLHAMADDTLAMIQKSEEKGLELYGNAKVHISKFKGVTYIGVREFYKSGGEMKHGTRGVNMTIDCWQKLFDSHG